LPKAAKGERHNGHENHDRAVHRSERVVEILRYDTFGGGIGTAGSSSSFSSRLPTRGTGWPDGRFASASSTSGKTQRREKNSAVTPYWMPIILWSVEKTYLRQIPISS